MLKDYIIWGEFKNIELSDIFIEKSYKYLQNINNKSIIKYYIKYIGDIGVIINSYF